MTSHKTLEGATVAIIGAGLGGLCLALDLQKKGFNDFIIYERDDAVGGTWNNNRYPGCRCDIGAILYSHSRFTNPNWTQTHPPREEILQYWKDIAEKQGLLPHIQFHTNYITGSWQPDHKAWDVQLETPSGKITTRHQFLVSAIGGFSTPKIPNVPGLKEFKGQVVHTATWPRDLGVEDLRGKEVMVVGNGCSGVQLASTLARDPKVKVIILSKSKHWMAPSVDPEGPHTETFGPVQKAIHHIPPLFWLKRFLTYVNLDRLYIILLPSSAWLRKIIEKRMSRWMLKRAPEDIKDKIIPDFPYGGKRIIFDGGYLRSLNYPNVKMVWDSLDRVSETTITTGKGQTFSPDVIALATGFATEIGLEMFGREGYSILTDRSHTRQYLGTSTPGFPNMFTMLGANTAPGLFSVLYHLEVQAEYVSDIIVKTKQYKTDVVEVKQSVTDKYNEWLDNRLDKSVWGHAKHYFRTDGGTGRIFTHFPGPGILFWWLFWSVDWNAYTGAEKIARDQRTKKSITIAGVMAVAGALAWAMTR